jgi:hypothetical protein
MGPTMILLDDWNLRHEALKSSLSTGSAAIVLGLSWFVGQRLTYAWNIRQKRRELQLSALQQFYVAYGEFFAVWKLWNRLDRKNLNFDERAWELHKRAAAAEAIVEGTLVKLCCELPLTAGEIETLARFRQLFQQLRQSIRQHDLLPWLTSETPAYQDFKKLAVAVAFLLKGDSTGNLNSQRISGRNLLDVTSNRWEKEFHEQQKN